MSAPLKSPADDIYRSHATMPSMARLLPLLLAAVAGVLCDDGPVTIDQSDVYKQQRVCARQCFVEFKDPGYPIAQEISCPTFRVQNDCFCRPYLQQQAHQFVYTCISTRCGASDDISVATKLYDDYCTSNGFITTQNAPPSETEGAPPITSLATPGRITPPSNPSPTSGSSPPAPKTTFTSSSGGTGEQKSNSGDDGGGGTRLSGGELAGIIVGVVSAVATVIGVFFAWKTYKKSKDKGTSQTPEVRGHPGWN
ncbi:hypothetical protein QBC37DRAFT_427436 [Rhypophila decipiens]|uniref:Extracellular membrane protein CFEM domain-containing protein n=1 Tax=Rhypophila decipiens TaxID=261697 RepID=A0AAN7B5W0_9PEZI|nr:hypothetical protein QBC37DRAFT_427436 [Rhypophila decipiens]